MPSARNLPAAFAAAFRGTPLPRGLSLVERPERSAESRWSDLRQRVSSDLRDNWTDVMQMAMNPSERTAHQQRAYVAAGVVEIEARGIDLARGLRTRRLGNAATMLSLAGFRFKPPGMGLMRWEDDQMQFNTIWPSVMGGKCEAQITRDPAKGDRALRFPRLVAIELRDSGTGDDPATSRGGPADKGDIGLSFAVLGAVDSGARGLGVPTAAASRQPTEPVYFLIATRQAAADDPALASERSPWVAVQPVAGRVTISANAGEQGRDATALRAARSLDGTRIARVADGGNSRP